MRFEAGFHGRREQHSGRQAAAGEGRDRDAMAGAGIQRSFEGKGVGDFSGRGHGFYRGRGGRGGGRGLGGRGRHASGLDRFQGNQEGAAMRFKQRDMRRDKQELDVGRTEE